MKGIQNDLIGRYQRANGVLTKRVEELEAELSQQPAWHDKPTGPGLWVCWFHPRGGKVQMPSVVDLAEEDLDRGAPFYTSRVYGPIPADGGA